MKNKLNMQNKDINLFCVRAEFGSFTQHFLDGGYVAIGWLPNNDLSGVSSRDELYPLYKNEYPKDTSNVVIGQQVGQISRFLHEIKSGDYVITPAQNTDFIYYGVIKEEAYYFADDSDGCPYLHRKKVKWNKEPIQRSQFSVPFQNTIRSSLTVFYISHKQNFFTVIGKPELVSESEKKYRNRLLPINIESHS
jgi:predicted Mrr-cat superfamily restriction endonuclease